ncbi:unnamed protein product [Rhizophagus irregularis]|nr:unnamed protein product [Rhizophagus irregularis]
MGEVSIEIDIDKTYIGKTDIDESHKPHNGKPINRIVLSTDEKYVVTYNYTVQTVKTREEIKRLFVTDDKKLFFSALDREKPIILFDMENNQEIKLPSIAYRKISFYKNNYFQFITHDMLWTYTKNKNNEWTCESIYSLPDECGDYHYVWNTLTERSFRVFNFTNRGKGMYDIFKDSRIKSDENFLCIRYGRSILIYSLELEAAVASLDALNDIEVYKFLKHTNLHSLLLSTLDYVSFKVLPGIWNSMIEHCWKKCIDRLKKNNQLPKEYQPQSIPYKIQITDEYAYGFLDGCVWKFKLDFSDFSYDYSLNDDDKVNVKSYDYLNIHLFNRYMNKIHAVFMEEISPTFNESIKWELSITPDSITLKVFKKVKVNNEWEWNFICTRTDKHNYFTLFLQRIISSSLLSNDDIVILTSMGLFIYHFDEYNKSIILNYFYRMQLNGTEGEEIFPYYRDELFSKSLPIPSYESFKLNDEWISYLINDRLSLLKYGTELLSFAIKEHKTELIDNIYKNCITLFRQDLSDTRNYLNLLGIITTSMPLLNKCYPDYITRFSLDTVMIIDSPNYHIRHRRAYLHHHAFFRNIQPENFNRTIPWIYYINRLRELRKNRFWYYLLKLVKYLVLILILPLLPFYCALCNLLLYCHFVCCTKDEDILTVAYIKTRRIFRLFRYYTRSNSNSQTVPEITFIIPYIKFVNYPQDYDWYWELIKPKTSPFIEVKNRDIYKTWSVHLSFEIRQLIFNPSQWIHDFWNLFDMIAYLLPIYTSIHWLVSNELNGQIIQLLSFSCLFLDIKFLLFFRAFESFGVYFAIIVSVGRQIMSFLVVLLIIVMSFAHAFFILLIPRSDYTFEELAKNDDPNNPWNISPAYNQVFDNGTIDSKPFMVQPPNENTNMFIDYRTSLFAMYLFLTGDSSSLSNWSYKSNPPLAILIVLFSLLIVVYLMNLLIGLLNFAIEKDNNRVSYLMQKVEILAEIELFYLLPHQRRCQEWFPELIYYFANVDKTREKIKEMINNDEWKTDYFPEMKQELLNKLNIQHNPHNDKVFMDKLEEIYIMISKLSKEQSPQVEKN